MFSHMIIGQYMPLSSCLHRLDARAKIIATFVLVLVVFLINNWFMMLTFSICILIVIGLSKVPILYVYKGLKPILILVFFTFLLHVFFTNNGQLLVEWGPISIYSGGIIQGFFISLRLILVVTITSILTLTTSPIELTDGLEYLFTPFKKVGLPAHELALMMSIALRFIPTFMQEADKISKAQMARGVDFRSGPWKDRIKAFLPLIIPLFMSAFKRAEELALAMEARGYDGGEGRTNIRELIWKWNDTFSLCIVGLLTVSILLVR
ncbi:energy-coupling factor transporter transmembrane component T family protein [Alkalihalobacillus trypoxylicola]|uniref:Energy-coupling factor transporter transmembrane protein EcfT n=1 Tax=Alkalihalobacillus trypoxylicola TaxID=519424 RepID=A0A162EWJ4_9BACI|nr:energy-coupling factor transporter transmembrane component T [Alkalihalobacillus trypoxylicola]KYG33907.1 cobalt ABC transporter permease [Alkalihalobacillus trypoxylicola]